MVFFAHVLQEHHVEYHQVDNKQVWIQSQVLFIGNRRFFCEKGRVSVWGALLEIHALVLIHFHWSDVIFSNVLQEHGMEN